MTRSLLVLSFLLVACGGRQVVEVVQPLALSVSVGSSSVDVVVPPGETVLLDPSTGELLDVNTLLVRWHEADVIYVGEEHDQTTHHDLQRRIGTLMAESGPTGIGFEMVDWHYQHVLDEFINRERSDRWLWLRLEWEDNWAMDWELYSEIFTLGYNYRVDLLALNAPRTLSRRVFEVGLDGLSDDERAQLPTEYDRSNEDYRAFLAEALAAHAEGGHALDDMSLDRFEEAQLTWDESMAQTLANALTDEPARRWLVVLGAGHVQHRWGVPSRLTRRVAVTDRTIVCSALGRDGTDPQTEAQAIFDEPPADVICLSIAE